MNYTEEALSMFVTYAISKPEHRQMTTDVYLRLTDRVCWLTDERIALETVQDWSVDICLN